MFKKAVGIWLSKDYSSDEYAEFYETVKVGNDYDNAVLRIAVDSNYSMKINGVLAAFGQYADYPEYKVNDEICIGKYLHSGENRIDITVWYYGLGSLTYKVGQPYLLFEIENNAEIICHSSDNTLSRQSSFYISHRNEIITSQLGLTYRCDSIAPEREYNKSTDVGIDGGCFNTSPVKKLILSERMNSVAVQSGGFRYNGAEASESVARQMQYAELNNTQVSALMPFTVTPSGDGAYFIVDIGAERSGFLDFDIETGEICDIDIAYGEHLTDGRCRTRKRNFICYYKASAGRNVFTAEFRRFGCRYLQFFVHTAKPVKVNYAGLRPTEYPHTYKEFVSKEGNALREKIYAVSQNTLLQCMHEHYEDCPWREQGFYTMDSRNQMLCGYYAFKDGNTEFARAGLKLISYGLRKKDSLLSICYPAGENSDLPIPFFSLMYFIQMREYIEYSNDTSLAEEKYGVLEKLISTFNANYRKLGLIGNFYGDKGSSDYWNFYEWSPTLSGEFRDTVPTVDAPLNATYKLALDSMAVISEKTGHKEAAGKYRAEAEALRIAIYKGFFNKDTGLFESYLEKERGRYSVLTNSLCLLCGAADECVSKENILRILVSNGGDNLGLEVIPNTLSMNTFRFDALLREDREKYREVILSELDRDYKYMLDRGATSFWETILGDGDFDGVGSLCHGWSALPIYYYEILNA